MDKLRSCPFCGYTWPDSVDVFPDHRHNNAFVGVCSACGAIGPDASDTREEASGLWNKRAIDSLLEEIRDFLAAPQHTSRGLETHRAESEGVNHLLSGVVDALGGE